MAFSFALTTPPLDLLVMSAISWADAPARYSSTRQNTCMPLLPAPYWARAHMRSPVSSHMVFMVRTTRSVLASLARVSSSFR